MLLEIFLSGNHVATVFEPYRDRIVWRKQEAIEVYGENAEVWVTTLEGSRIL